MNTILLVEDDENLNRGISLKLSKEGYRVLSAFSRNDAENLWKADNMQKSDIQMVICDITLPDGNGLDFGKMVHGQSDIYLIYLTALDQEIDIVNGYDTGADDYITKPFSVNILMSKVNALMRRLGKKESSVILSGEIEVYIKDMLVKRAGNTILLSKTEIQLLVYLLENAGKIISKESIMEKIWGIDGLFIDDNTVTVNISRLKNKLGADFISNVRGLGYVWTGKVTKK